ncbi:hypothetical protein EST38_g8822 [Candolleomyces aberdarensis]|uniref:F-box domain-containing protein n=1 Tax=Candolleomyces aberdarensis TaxID=2316362 RepID=A0A4Q2DCB4_9AGAR|nr:hypothetical protein EST38_g8822 [Candolleomyces aberdarensis]
MKVPLDTFVDDIFPYLSIEDILSLRRVNKCLYLLTHQPIIWRRFLIRMDFPIPPLRPTFEYTLPLTDYEIEQLVTQAITVDDNWRSPTPKIYNRRLLNGFYMINDLCLLPGGKYLVASVVDRNCSHWYWLYLYVLDSPWGPRPVARIQTLSKAYNIQAKYVKLRAGEDGILVAYTRRFNKGRVLERDIASKLSHEQDVDANFRYNVVTVYAKLDDFELLTGPKMNPESGTYSFVLDNLDRPFLELGIADTSYRVTQSSIFEANEKTYMAMIAQPAEMHFINVLDKTEHSCCIFKEHNSWPTSPYRLRAFRIYPNQNDMVVIRTVTPSPGVEHHLIEWYELPLYKGVVRLTAKARYTLQNKKVRKFVISDYGVPNKTKLNPKHPDLRHTLGPPPPVSIFLEREDPEGVEHHAIYPHQQLVPEADGKPAHYKYVYNHDSYQMATHMCGPNRAKILPGSTRALICMMDGQDKSDSPQMVSLRRYVHPKNAGIHYEPDPPPQEDVLPVLAKKPRLPMPKTGVFRTFFEAQDIVNEVNAAGGLRAICWDESTGRICLAAELSNDIRILDCSHMVMPDARQEEIQRKMEYVDEITPVPPPTPTPKNKAPEGGEGQAKGQAEATSGSESSDMDTSTDSDSPTDVESPSSESDMDVV